MHLVNPVANQNAANMTALVQLIGRSKYNQHTCQHIFNPLANQNAASTPASTCSTHLPIKMQSAHMQALVKHIGQSTWLIESDQYFWKKSLLVHFVRSYITEVLDISLGVVLSIHVTYTPRPQANLTE